MKKYNATFKVIKWYNGGKAEHIITRTIEARTIESAKKKAEKMETYGSARTWNLLQEVSEVA